jgi:hypothetical protein
MSDVTKRSVILLAALLAAGTDPAALKDVADKAIAIVQEQETTLEDAQITIDESVKFNLELQEKLEAAKSGIKVLPSIKVGDNTYEAVHGVFVDGKKYSPEEIAENADVAAKLVKGKSSALVLKPEITE